MAIVFFYLIAPWAKPSSHPLAVVIDKIDIPNIAPRPFFTRHATLFYSMFGAFLMLVLQTFGVYNGLCG